MCESKAVVIQVLNPHPWSMMLTQRDCEIVWQCQWACVKVRSAFRGPQGSSHINFHYCFGRPLTLKIGHSHQMQQLEGRERWNWKWKLLHFQRLEKDCESLYTFKERKKTNSFWSSSIIYWKAFTLLKKRKDKFFLKFFLCFLAFKNDYFLRISHSSPSWYFVLFLALCTATILDLWPHCNLYCNCTVTL